MISSIALPQLGLWRTAEDVALYAQACMQACGLHDWSLKWDRAIRRLGCCKMSRREISLSQYFVAAYLERDQEVIRHTILHEVAHALAWLNYHERGHGEAWRLFCAALGIPDERSSCKCEDFSPLEHRRKQPKYVLCHCETGEIYHYYMRKPRANAQKLKRCYIPGKKRETLGKLLIVNVSDMPIGSIGECPSEQKK